MNGQKHHRIVFLTSILIVLLLSLLTNPILAYDVQLEWDDSTSTFSIESIHKFQAKLLTDPPASKIMVKLNDINLFKNHNYPDTLIFKNSTSIVEVRFLKIDETQILIIIDLLDKLKFGFIHNNSKFSILIEDSSLRNPLEKDYYYGLYYHKLKKLDEALKHYKKVLMLNEMHPEAHFEAGKIHFRMKQYQIAKNYFKKAYQYGKDQSEIYFYLGEVYKHLGKNNIAKSYYNIYQKSLQKESNQKHSPKVKKSEKNFRIKLV